MTNNSIFTPAGYKSLATRGLVTVLLAVVYSIGIFMFFTIGLSAMLGRWAATKLTSRLVSRPRQ